MKRSESGFPVLECPLCGHDLFSGECVNSDCSGDFDVEELNHQLSSKVRHDDAKGEQTSL